MKEFSRDGPCGNAPVGFPGAGASAALPVSDAVFGLSRVVRVRRAVEILHLFIRLGARIVVANQDGDRRTERLPLERSRDDLSGVRLLAWRRESTLARASPIQIALDLLGRDGQPRRAAIHHHTDCSTVALAKAGDTKDSSETAAHRP
jgi:hypothetical protein